MLGKNNNNSILPDHTSEAELCNEFAQFFKNKVINIRNGITAPLSGNVFQTLEYTSENVKKFNEFDLLTSDDVLRVLSSLANKQCELDPIPMLLFKKCITYLLPYVTHIVNSSLSSGVFPKQFKNAMVRPVIKNTSADKNVFGNFRPISNLCFLSKFIEKCVLEQLLSHLDKNELFNAFQSAYRRFHSCETAMAKITNDILNNLDTRKNTFLIFLRLKCCLRSSGSLCSIEPLKR